MDTQLSQIVTSMYATSNPVLEALNGWQEIYDHEMPAEYCVYLLTDAAQKANGVV